MTPLVQHSTRLLTLQELGLADLLSHSFFHTQDLFVSIISHKYDRIGTKFARISLKASRAQRMEMIDQKLYVLFNRTITE